MKELTLLQMILTSAPPLIFAITLHEVAHGWVASLFGDQTARLSGRLSINPVKHIDLIGTIIVPLVLFITTRIVIGWAKPVPVDPRNLRHPNDMIWVALAGPVSNFLMACFWAAMIKFSVMLDPSIAVPLYYMGSAGLFINLLLGVLNCLPLPPLDGSKVLYQLLPPKMAWHFSRLEPFGFWILMALALSGLLQYLLLTPVYFLLNLIVSLFNL